MCFLCQTMPKEITREELWKKWGIARNGLARLDYVINVDEVPQHIRDEFNKSKEGIVKALEVEYSEEHLKELAERREKEDRELNEYLRSEKK